MFVAAVVSLLAATGLIIKTRQALQPIPDSLPPWTVGATDTYLDRNGVVLAEERGDGPNLNNQLSWEEVPPLLRDAFVVAEDKRFWNHGGVDWLARMHAAVLNARSLRAVRGASTISEQVIRINRPRPRTPWSRWVEGFESQALEARFTKEEILTFYLNQVPYGRRRRGVVQAARETFDRELGTLGPSEILTLAVLVRSPSRLDPHRDPKAARPAVLRLADELVRRGLLSTEEREAIVKRPLRVRAPRPPVDARHFLAALPEQAGPAPGRTIRTTLDANLQHEAREILDRNLERLAERRVGDGAVLVADHQSGEVLAWVNGFGFQSDRDAGHIDKVTVPRQPGSTLKPFVYGMAMERGWTAATIIDDAPLVEAVGNGQHSFRNYSRTFYGPVRLRVALANSLNTPAVRAVQHIGTDAFLERLHHLGFASLDRDPSHYGEGLALGNGEVTLEELVTAYAAIARGGEWRPLIRTLDEQRAAQAKSRRVMPYAVATLLGDMLSDPKARQLEFGGGSVLDRGRQTAIKTGTSNDHRDAWAVGFDSRYVVGVWMGNADRSPTVDVSGSFGPALALRSVFDALTRRAGASLQPERLNLDPQLVQHAVCSVTGARAALTCPRHDEWFRRGHEPQATCPVHGSASDTLPTTQRAAHPSARQRPAVRLESPTPGLHLALDPRIPDELEAFALRLASAKGVALTQWYVDNHLVGKTGPGERHFIWQPTRGEHNTYARVLLTDGQTRETPVVAFAVR